MYVKDVSVPLSEEDCFKKLVSKYWKYGYKCRKCGSREHWNKADRRILVCKKCRKEVSPLSGTMFSRSHLSLVQWLEIIRMVTCSPEIVVTAKGVLDGVGIGSYRTAWEALRKIRFAVSRNLPRFRLKGNIEFDELVIAGRGSDYSKVSILGALEVDGEKRLSLKIVKNPDEMNIKDYFRKTFSRGAKIITDSEKLYIRNWLELNRIRQTGCGDVYGHNFMNLHVVLQDIKYAIRNGHYGVSEDLLQAHLDEFVYIFNHNDDRAQAYELLLEYMMKTKISSYRQSLKRERSFFSIIRGGN